MNRSPLLRSRALGALAVAMAITGCSAGDDDETSSSPVAAPGAAGGSSSTAADSPPTSSAAEGRSVEAALRAVYDDRIVATHQALSDRADELASVAESSCATDLPAVQAAFRATRLAWDAASAYPIGAHLRLRLRPSVDWFPVDPAAIDAAAAGEQTMTAEELDALGAPARGLRAIEHLLWSASPPVGRRCSYVGRAAESIALKARAVIDQLDVEREPFVTRGDAAVGDLLNALSAAIYRVCDEDLAMPAGVRVGTSQPNPSYIRQGGATMALADVRAVLAEVRRGYEVGILPLLEARYPGQPDPIKGVFDRWEAEVGELGDDLASAIQLQLESVYGAVGACRDLRRVIVTETAALLGIVLVLPVSDGD